MPGSANMRTVLSLSLTCTTCCETHWADNDNSDVEDDDADEVLDASDDDDAAAESAKTSWVTNSPKLAPIGAAASGRVEITSPLIASNTTARLATTLVVLLVVLLLLTPLLLLKPPVLLTFPVLPLAGLIGYVGLTLTLLLLHMVPVLLTPVSVPFTWLLLL